MHSLRHKILASSIFLGPFLQVCAFCTEVTNLVQTKDFSGKGGSLEWKRWMCDDVCGAVSPPPSRARNFPQTCPCSSDEGNSRTGRNFFHSAKLCFKVSVSSAAGAATFPEAQRIVSRVFGHRASDIPLCISSRLPDMNLALARGSIADQTLLDFRIPPLLDDGSRGTVSGWISWVWQSLRQREVEKWRLG